MIIKAIVIMTSPLGTLQNPNTMDSRQFIGLCGQAAANLLGDDDNGDHGSHQCKTHQLPDYRSHIRQPIQEDKKQRQR